MRSKRETFKNISVAFSLAVCFTLFAANAFAQKLHLNDAGYFETTGVNLLVFNNQYTGVFFDEKTAGIELIHHGVRTVTGGAVRLQNTPEQWDLIPAMTDRKINKATNSVEFKLTYPTFDFTSKVVVTGKGNGVEINVYLDKPVPEKLEGKAGFNIEFLPTAYFEKTYLMDGKPDEFPLYPAGATEMHPISEKIPQFAGHTTFDDRGRGEFIVPHPLASGKMIVLAPEDPERMVTIKSMDDSGLSLFDGRNLAQNGWFIVRSLFPVKKTGKVLTWYMEANSVPNWKRAPVIEFSQVGYNPGQAKTAVVELDQNDFPLKTASLFQVLPDGKYVEKLKGNIQPWGHYLRYNYVKFNFSAVKDAGLYFIKYGNQKTNTFPIGPNVYDDIWHPTLDVYFPEQMDHMQVNEAYRVWHGASFMDDALQAPINHQHFDGYRMGPTTDTKYKSLERIPGMAVGGWYDAGDFDIQTNSHCAVLLSMVDSWENFKIDRDETYIDHATHYVDMHRPDGKPDILQQIEHGTLNLVAQMKNIGHPVVGIVVPNLHQYHHLGDGAQETDNLPYNPALKPYETDGKSSGTMDDRWAFTNRQIFLDYWTTAALAAANRALKGYNDTLADQCLMYAKKLSADDDSLIKKTGPSSQIPQFGRNFEGLAALQLYITTKDEKYATHFKEMIFPALDRAVGQSIAVALQAYPYMDKDYQSKIRDYVTKYKALCDSYDKQNPYGIPTPMRGGWGGNQTVINWAITNYYANKLFPDIISPEYVYKGLNYIFGCHPYSNVSFVAAVGTRSKKVTYTNNRADFHFIAGGVVPGLVTLKPDFMENKDDWPFLWGENEVVIDICAQYIFLSVAADRLAAGK